MFNHTVSAILRGSWLIEKGFADAHVPLVVGLLKGNVNGSEFLKGSEEFELPLIMDAFGNSKPAFVMTENGLKVTEIEPNSVAVIPFIGPMMKYNGECGEPGMIKRTSWIKTFYDHPNIKGIVSIFDTPGGQADGTPQLASYIKNISKPTAAVILGGAYSAGAWIYAAHDVAYAGDKYAQVGSIGAYTTIVDYTGYFEKEGFKVQTIYPEISKDKNKSYRDAIAGNTKLIEQEIHDLASAFVDEYSEYRGSKLTSTEWNTGKTFKADEAIQMGMLDGIKSLTEVVAEMINGSAFSSKQPNNSQKQQSNLKFNNVSALAGVENPSQEQIDQANADLTTAGVTKVTLVPESFIANAESVTTDRDSLTSQLTESETSLATANTTIANLQTEIKALKKGPGASHQPAGGKDEQPDLSDDEETEKILAAMPHNKTADALFG